MRLITRRVATGLLLVPFAPIRIARAEPAAATTRITFVLVNDIYLMSDEMMSDGKRRGGFARLAAVVKAERAKGGAGLVFIEMTCVSPEGRITPGCTGMYAPEHEVAWKRIVDFVHSETHAKICCQLGHSGPKGSTQLGWQQSDAPLASGNQ